MRNWKQVKNHPNIYEYSTAKGKKYGIRRGFKNSVGKADEFTKSGLKSWRDADIILKRFEADLANGNLNPLANKTITFGKYFKAVSERNIKLNKWRITTAKQKESYFNSFLKDKYENVPLSDFTRPDYQKHIDELIEKGYAETTIYTLNGLVQSLFNKAERDEVINKNKLKGVEILGAVAPRDVSLEPSQYKKFMDTATQCLSKYRLTMLYLIALGSRREEAAGLQFRSFERSGDKSGPFYVITYFVGRTPLTLTGGPLKNSTSQRSNIVRGEIVNYIDYFLDHTREILTMTNRIISAETFVYVNEKTGLPVHPSNINRDIFQVVSEKSGIKVRPHMLRHYFATMALADGVPDMEVANWLGHKEVTMTQEYARPTQYGAEIVSSKMMSTLFSDNNDDEKH